MSESQEPGAESIALETPPNSAVEPEPEEPAGAAEPRPDTPRAAAEPAAQAPDGADAPDGAENAEDEAAPGPGCALSDDELLQAVTALVFASPDPLSVGRLGKLLEGPEPARVRAALAALRERLEGSGLPLELRSIAAGWQLLTAPALGDVVARLFQSARVERISPAALETLAIVAYRQPVTKAEIEAIRGVQAGPLLRTLVDRGLIRVSGRSDQPGHALQYGTTRAFLDRFCLESLDDLPRDGELAD
jgi:segregation and condensation protein B